ncbi:MAG: biotin/lipoyl-binding protein, partial [Magnetococcales bacterium]|nr:biotin/lipoyl-binding protein [Magnetococcales bacterium]
MFQNRFSQHLSEAEILEENGISWQVKLVLAGTLLITVILLWLATYLKSSEAVKATGEFLPIQGVQRVSPPEGGIVTEILAENGQIVNQGDLLVRLENATAAGEARQVEARLMGLNARAIRLEAFLQGTVPDFSS